jgi:hypothetical protein
MPPSPLARDLPFLRRSAFLLHRLQFLVEAHLVGGLLFVGRIAPRRASEVRAGGGVSYTLAVRVCIPFALRPLPLHPGHGNAGEGATLCSD